MGEIRELALQYFFLGYQYGLCRFPLDRIKKIFTSSDVSSISKEEVDSAYDSVFGEEVPKN